MLWRKQVQRESKNRVWFLCKFRQDLQRRYSNRLQVSLLWAHLGKGIIIKEWLVWRPRGRGLFKMLQWINRSQSGEEMSRRESEERSCHKMLREKVASMLLLKLQVTREPLVHKKYLQHFRKFHTLKSLVGTKIEGKYKTKFLKKWYTIITT